MSKVASASFFTLKHHEVKFIETTDIIRVCVYSIRQTIIPKRAP